MPTIINISGDIGWEVVPVDIQKQLNEAGGGDIDIHLNTPGGYVWDGIQINNMISDYKKNNTEAQVMITLKSIAASMGSFIMANLKADFVVVEDNATWMVHHPESVTYGNYLDHDKTSGMLVGLSKILADQYSKKSGETIEESMGMMTEETWLFGQEIVDAGYADEVIKTDNQKDKSQAIALSKIIFQKVLAKIKTDKSYGDNFMQAAAFIGDFKFNTASKNSQGNINQEIKSDLSDNNMPAGSMANNQEVYMTLEELKAKNPELYNQAYSNGVEAGTKKEKERVAGLIEIKNQKEFKNIQAIHESIDESIQKGYTIDLANSKVNAILRNGNIIAAGESTGEITTGVQDTQVGGTPRASVGNSTPARVEV